MPRTRVDELSTPAEEHDISLVEMLHGLDCVLAADVAKRVLVTRAAHPFPPEFAVPGEWRPEVETLAKQPEAVLR